jgi:hypothetical protein
MVLVKVVLQELRAYVMALTAETSILSLSAMSYFAENYRRKDDNKGHIVEAIFIQQIFRDFINWII